jgi:hypothetical protein
VGPVPPIEPRICPHCQQGRLIFIRTLTRQQAMARLERPELRTPPKSSQTVARPLNYLAFGKIPQSKLGWINEL